MSALEIRMMLDSGAYSAWRRGKEIDLARYIEFIKENASLLSSYVCLDTIPGKMGVMDHSQVAIESSAAASYRNQQIMKDAGLHPIPVFHQGERFEWLERYLRDGESYIGISPYSASGVSDQRRWLDECFTRLTDAHGRPLVRTHGFGVTWYAFMMRYPWTTCDSTSWVLQPVYGKVTIPVLSAAGDFDPLLGARAIYVGAGRSTYSERKVDGLGDRELSWITKYAEYCGLTLTELRNDEYARLVAQVKFFSLLESRLVDRRFIHRKALFSSASPAKSEMKSIKNKFWMVFATTLARDKKNGILNTCGVSDRLVSYYVLQGNAARGLVEYVGWGRARGAAASVRASSSRRKLWSGAYETLRIGALVNRLSSGDLEYEQEAVN